MDEWVIVEYPIRRRVDVDGAAYGMTQGLIQVDTGHHTFDLATPVDYTPKFQNVSVSGTSPSMPLRVMFTPLSAAFVRLAEAPKPAARKAIGAARKRAPKRKKVRTPRKRHSRLNRR